MASIRLAPQAQRAKRVLCQYAITLKYVKSDRNPVSQDYYDYIDRHSKDIEWGEHLFELDHSYPPKLHYHGVTTARKNYYSKLLQEDGMHVFMVPLYDDVGWLEYIHKHSSNAAEQEELVITNDIQHGDYPYKKRGVGVLPIEALPLERQRLERKTVGKACPSKASRTINKVQKEYLKQAGLTLKFD